MRSGRLRYSAVIQTPTVVVDDYGDPVTTWSTFATVRTGVEPLSGKEYEKFGITQSDNSTRFPMRYISGVTSAMRVSFDGKYYAIIAPPLDPNYRHRELILICVEKSYDQS